MDMRGVRMMGWAGGLRECSKWDMDGEMGEEGTKSGM